MASNFLITEKKEERFHKPYKVWLVRVSFSIRYDSLGLVSDKFSPNIDYIDRPLVKLNFPVEKKLRITYKWYKW